MGFLTEPGTWISLLTLTALEIVLGIDNLVFLSIAVNRLPEHQQAKARQLGLSLACILRLALLASITWLARLTTPLFSFVNYSVSLRDLIFLGGGLFLVVKAVSEMHATIEAGDEKTGGGKANAFSTIIFQIILFDLIFSLDSVITAVGMAKYFTVMAVAIIIAVILMIVASGPLSRFINRHPTIKLLALSFLLMVGIVLIADGLQFHIPRGYLYFAMAFSVFVEFLNSVLRKRRRTRSQRRRN